MGNFIISIWILIGGIYAHQLSDTDFCTISDFYDVAAVTATCNDIVIGDVFVPAGETLLLNLRDGATVTIRGNVTFGYINWAGPLMSVNGHGITVQGEKGHILNGQGELYWDGKGSWGNTKPKFLIVRATNGSIFKNLRLFHAPMHGVAINNSDGVIFSNILVDNAAGAENVAPGARFGHNTDGFGVRNSTNVIIKDSKVYNQDDCVVLNSGSNILVSNMLCYGSHGLSVSVGFSNDTEELNSLTDVIIENSVIFDASNGIHIKTHIDAGRGIIKNATFRNIEIIGSISYGISIEQNYTNAFVPETGALPLSNIPIVGLTMSHIVGTVRTKALPYYVVCAQDGCLDWNWNDVQLYGQNNSSCVNYHPEGIACTDYIV